MVKRKLSVIDDKTAALPTLFDSTQSGKPRSPAVCFILTTNPHPICDGSFVLRLLAKM